MMTLAARRRLDGDKWEDSGNIKELELLEPIRKTSRSPALALGGLLVVLAKIGNTMKGKFGGKDWFWTS